MSKRYSLAACAAAVLCLAGPAGADGYAGRTVERGPEPLRAHAAQQPAPDCELVGGRDWYCPPAETRTRRYVDETQTRHYVTRYTTGGACCLQAAPAPPPRKTVYHKPAPRDLSIDISGFNGGVGAGVDGGYYGGGGGVFVYASANASASASASASMRFSFKGGHKGKRGKRGKGGGGCSPCGGR